MSLTKLSIKESLKEISFYSNVNKIELYVTKKEIILLKNEKKICRKRIHVSSYVKYLGVTIDQNPGWKIHINDISTKVIKGNVIVSKLVM